MRYNEISETDGKKLNRSKETTLEELKQYLPRLQIALSNPHRIYRGLSNYSGSASYFYVDPTQYTRVSANTTNYYTLIMDNSPEWHDYPKRSKSLVCSTTFSVANSYSGSSKPYVVLPLDNPKIAICPASDLWISFKYSLRGGARDSLSEVNSALKRAYAYYFQSKELNQFDWNIFYSQLKELENVTMVYSDDTWWLYTLKPFIVDSKFSVDRLFSMLSPNNNNFHLANLSNLNNFDVYNSEVWFSGPALLVYFSDYEDFLEDIKNASL